nr:PREDICTED: odorant receptor 13a-like [Linepithema humile]
MTLSKGLRDMSQLFLTCQYSEEGYGEADFGEKSRKTNWKGESDGRDNEKKEKAVACEKLEDLVRMLGPLLNCGMGSIKYSLLVYHSKEIRDCEHWSKVCGFFCRFHVCRRAVLPNYRAALKRTNADTDEHYGFLTYSVTCGAAGLAAFFIMHVCGQLSILIGKLQHLNDMKPEDRAVAILLADIVEHQIKVKNFLKQVEEAMQYIWLVEIVGSTVLLCLTGYYVIMEWERSDSTAMLTMFVILTSFTFSIFTICYVGQLLTDQSIKVGLMTSMTDWHRLPHKRARTLILIIAISNIPAKISAGKMIEMSLPTFGNIIKTSMAYFNLLRKFIT